MNILLLVSEGGRGNSVLAYMIASYKNVNVEVITVKKTKMRLLTKIKKIIQDSLIFIYAPNFTFKYFIANLFEPNQTFVDNINSLDVSRKIDEFSPDLLVISGTRKVNQFILDKVKLKLNLHHGIVPFYRGVSSSSWVAYERDFGNFGITVHEPTNILDEGALLACERVLPFRGEPLWLFKYRVFWAGYCLLLNCIKQIIEAEVTWTIQDKVSVRNLKHADKPSDFLQHINKANNDFDKFGFINGTRNLFFHPRFKFKNRKIKEELNCGWYVLNYHAICTEAEAHHYKNSGFPSIFSTLSIFISHLEYMQQVGEILSVEDALKLWVSGNFPERVVFSITFDDGLSSSLDTMHELKTFGIKPTLFLSGTTTFNSTAKLNIHPHIKDLKDDKHGTSGYFSVNELIRLSENQKFSFEIGSHTFNHKSLTHLSAKEVEYEIVDCHHQLERAFKTKIPYFSFPSGKLNSRNYHADKATRTLGAKVFECYGGVNKSFQEHFNVLRIGVHNETKAEFQRLLRKQWVR